MSEQASPSKAVIVFVHGFGSSGGCWTPLMKLLREDEAINSRFDFDSFDYSTLLFDFHPLRRIPSLKDVSEKLREHLDSEKFRDRQLTLVGHSQGGLVIHAYLKDMLTNGQGRKLKWNRQVITLATPHLGSTTASLLRRLVFRFFDNPQERTLRVHDPATAEIVGTVVQRAAETNKADDLNWPIPVYCFGGLRDDVVVKASAQGPFANYKPLEGDHSKILVPKDRQDDRYRELAEILLDPVGHPHVFEVEHYKTTIALSPVAMQKCRIKLGEGQVREVETDNLCELTRTVQFARNNRCQSRFKIRYLAFGGSCFTTKFISHKNEAGQLASEYEQSAGTKLDYLFTPRSESPDEEYMLGLTIYNGFGEGRRDIHFHLGPNSVGGMAYYRKLTYELDLSKYMEAGYVVTSAPTLYWHSEDPGNCRECKNLRTPGKRVQPVAESVQGLWRWELVNVRDGVADLVWDVAPAEEKLGEPGP